MGLLAENPITGAKVRVVLCWVIGLSLIYSGAHDITGITGEGGITGSFGTALIGMAKGVLGAIFLAPSLANVVAQPLFRLIDSIYLPGGHAGKPPLDYKLAEYYRKTRQFDLAIEQYAGIARYYPNELEAQAWLFVLVGSLTDDRRRAMRIYRKAKRRFHRRGRWREFRKRAVEARASLI